MSIGRLVWHGFIPPTGQHRLVHYRHETKVQTGGFRVRRSVSKHLEKTKTRRETSNWFNRKWVYLRQFKLDTFHKSKLLPISTNTVFKSFSNLSHVYEWLFPFNIRWMWYVVIRRKKLPLEVSECTFVRFYITTHFTCYTMENIFSQFYDIWRYSRVWFT